MMVRQSVSRVRNARFEHLLEGAYVGPFGRQEQQAGAACLDRSTDACNRKAVEVIDDDNVNDAEHRRNLNVRDLLGGLAAAVASWRIYNPKRLIAASRRMF